MNNIFCPYCTEEVGLLVDGTVMNHNIGHNDPGPEKCPMSGEQLTFLSATEVCRDCGQTVKSFSNQNGKLVLEGHNFSWANGSGGERIKAAPTGSFFSRVWCNMQSGVQPNPIMGAFEYAFQSHKPGSSILEGRR
jgi:hypothetical protein